MILQLLCAPILGRGNEVPHEALDFVIAAVMDQAVRQQGPADGLHVPLGQLFFKTAVVENILPATPSGKLKEKIITGILKLKVDPCEFWVW